MRLIITGVTGLIGKNLATTLSHDYDIIGLTRNPGKAQAHFSDDIKLIRWDGKTPDNWQNYLQGDYALINLAGEPIAGGRWTQKQKEKIINSRIEAAQALTKAIESADIPPKVVIQASATGFYGQHPEQEFTEESSPGSGFLSEATQKWEEAANQIKEKNIRMPVVRTGVVLSMESGALPQLLMPFRFYAGGYIGSGKQWVSWIHIRDEIKAIKFLLENENADGIYNLTAPQPVTMKTLARTAGKTLGKPSWTKAPAFILETFMGDMAKEMLTHGSKVMPQRLLNEGFHFDYPELNQALSNLLK